MAQETTATEASALDHVLDGDGDLRRAEQALRLAEVASDPAGITRGHAALEHMQGYTASYRAARLLQGLGFSNADCARPVASFSGGWRIRLNLAQALMCPSDLLLLDEPTNHLDLDATRWLEDWLLAYPGTVLVVAHDRDFLDRVATHVLHIEQGAIKLYRGNYSAFEVQRAAHLAHQQGLYARQQTRIAEVENFVRRFRAKASKARQAQSRLKELERMQRSVAAHVDSPFAFRIEAAEKVSDPLLAVRDLALGYDDHTVLSGVSMSLRPGTRLGLLGANGAGKSTLLKGLLGTLPARAGQRIAGQHLRTGYFAQQQIDILDLHASALEHCVRVRPGATEQAIRDFLGGFAFRGTAAEGPIAPMSGGEKARLALALIAWQAPNLLVLDEPTNHLDLEMRQALTVALQSFTGALVLVSHDRYLLRNCVDEFVLVADGRVDEFDGTLDDYASLLRERASATPAPTAQNSATARAVRQQAAARREQLAPLRKRVQAVEHELARAQAELAPVSAELGDSQLYSAAAKARLREMLARQAELSARVAALEAEWLSASAALEDGERAQAESTT
jgi:ATP-binding cassette subfamily F protein 3